MEYHGDKENLQSNRENKAKERLDLQELIHTVLDKLPLGVFVKDAEDHFKYLYWNRFMEEITGTDASVIEGYNDFEVRYDALMPAEQRLETDRYVMESGKTAEFKGKIKTVSGQYKDIEATKFPVFLSNGKPILLALWRDVTTKLEVESALKRTQILTKMALQTSDIRTCSIFVNPDSQVSFDDSIVSINDWDSPSDKMIEVPWKQFISRVHPDDVEKYNFYFRKLCAGELVELKLEVRVKYPNMPGYAWRETFAHVYERDAKTRPTVILGCSTNIQERKNQELSLEEAKSKAEAADKMKSKYLADMSHEIRTPLNAITGFSELMAFADTDEERMSYYEIIKTNNQLLMQLVNDILDLSKIEADAIKISYAPVNVNEIMDTVFASARLRVAEGVEVRIEKGADECIFGTDHLRLMQLITNLVNNAIKNTPTGSITIGYKCLPDHQLRFYVRDTGVGIPEEKLKNLFNRFVKLNDYMEGIGLGLAICKGFVTKMGGSIEVNSKVGVGSEFSFILPSRTA